MAVEQMEPTFAEQPRVAPRQTFKDILTTFASAIDRKGLAQERYVKSTLATIERKVKQGAKWQDLSMDERMFLWDQYMELYPTRFQSFYGEHLETMHRMVQEADGAGPKDIADLGCGTGTAVRAVLSSVTRNGSWPGVLRARDISEVSLSQYREAVDTAVDTIGKKTPQIMQLHKDIQRCDLETATLEEILPQDGEGDFVNLGWILPYLTDEGIKRTLEAVSGYLKEGGVVFVNVHVKGYSIKRMLLREQFSGLRETIPLLTKGKMRLKEVLSNKKVVGLFEKLSPGLPTAEEWEAKFTQNGLRVSQRMPIFHDKGKHLGVIYLLEKNEQPIS